MLGTVGNLALLPEFRTFVIVSILTYIVIFCLIEGLVRSTRLRRFIEVGLAAASIMISMAWSVYHSAGPLLIDKGMSFRHVSSDVEVQLIDVLSLKGWGEGEAVLHAGHEELLHGNFEINQRLPQARWVFDRIFDRMGLPRRSDELIGMTEQRQWVAFLRGLNSVQRHQIGKIPFAMIDVRTGDGHVQQLLMFRNDTRVVRDAGGAVAGVLCLDHVFDVADVVSGEREAVVLSHGRSSCG